MFLTPGIEKALSATLRIHEKQKRKGDRVTPYAVHPISVAMLLMRYTDDEDVIIAGLLHDALEDTNYRPEEIERNFGKRVLSIVQEVSEKNQKASWEQRKMEYLVNLKNKTKEACLVVCADKIHNIKSLMYAYVILGDDLWKRFNASKEKKLWFYEAIYKEIKKKFRHGLIREFHDALREIKGEKKTGEWVVERCIGPFEVVKWVHFSLNSDKGDYYLQSRVSYFKDAIKDANNFTKRAKLETLQGIAEDDKIDLKDYWIMSSSYGVLDSTGRMVYWADWFKV